MIKTEAGEKKFLEGQVAIITGSGYGIGQGIAVEFAKQGALLTLNDLHPKRTADTKNILKLSEGRLISVDGDITDIVVRQALVEQSITKLGGIDILINNVGIGSGPTPFLKTTPEQWVKIWQTNFFAGVELAKSAARHMIETHRKGKIIFITSIHQERIARDPIYSTSKAALKMLIEELAVDLAPYGIRVNGIAPGWIDTDPEAIAKHQPHPHEGKTPLGRAGLPEEIGRAAIFLASDYWSSYITGVVIPVDGGLRTLSHRTLEYPPKP